MAGSRSLIVACVALSLASAAPAFAQEQKTPEFKLPTPSPYPVSWDLSFEYKKPSRVVVEIPGQGQQAFWYLPYTVTNTTGQERMFLPIFEMVSEDGRITRSDQSTPPAVVEAIRVREGNRFIQSVIQAAGDLRIGPEEAKYGVAVWREPMADMGTFHILIGGLSGENQRVQSASGDEVILRKTLQLSFTIHGDEAYPGIDVVNEKPKQWIMR